MYIGGVMKKIISRISIIFPLAAVIGLFYFPVAISIPKLHLYLSKYTVFLIFFVLTTLWLNISPHKKFCINKSSAEIAFNVLPIGLLSLLVFSQWHPITGIILIAIWFVIKIVMLAHYYLAVTEEQPYSEEKQRVEQKIFFRCSVIITVLICTVPFFFSTFIYHFQSPVYKAKRTSHQKKEVTFSVRNTGNIYLKNKKNVNKLKTDQWNQLNIEDRITVLQSISDMEAQILGIPKVSVFASAMNETTLGKYQDGKNQIEINIEYLAESSPETCVSTVCHEVFHAYQHYMIKTVNWKSAAAKTKYFDELRAWRKNEKHYENGSTGFKAYQNQPLESSARKYAREETKRIFSYVP